MLTFGTRIPMTKKRTTAKATTLHKLPRQKRAEDTVAVIVEAAASILERDGFEGFNTNAVAEKAGVSIGSLYQYFPSKNALLSAVIEREAAPLLAVEVEIAGISQCRSCDAVLHPDLDPSPDATPSTRQGHQHSGEARNV